MRTVIENLDFSNKYHLFHYLGNLEFLLNICPTFEDYHYFQNKCNASDFWGRCDYSEELNQFNELITNHCHSAYVSLIKVSGRKVEEPVVHLKSFEESVDSSKYASYGAAVGLAVGFLESAIFGVFGLAIGALGGSIISHFKKNNPEYRSMCMDRFKILAFCNAIEAAVAYAKVLQPLVDELQEKMLDEEQIRLLRYLKKRNITTLIHVTDRDNVKSIMTHGLLPNSELERLKIKYFRPDKNRFDGHPNYLSLSISNRNDYLINYYKREGRIIEDQLIQVDSSVLVLNKSKRLYCDRNASAYTCKKGSAISNLEACFAERIEYSTATNNFLYNRKETNLPENFPTDPQAEILFGGPIEKEFLWTYSIPDYTREEAETFKTKNGRYPWDPDPDNDWFF